MIYDSIVFVYAVHRHIYIYIYIYINDLLLFIYTKNKKLEEVEGLKQQLAAQKIAFAAAENKAIQQQKVI